MALLMRAALCALFMTAAAFSTHRIEKDHLAKRAEQSFLYLPSSRYLEVASLGYKNALADIIYLWSIQYYGKSGVFHRFDYLWHIYDVITDLDPKFVDAYYLGHLVMVMDAEDRDLAVKILEKGHRNNPGEWQFLFNAGFIRYEQQRYLEAAEYFNRAMVVPGASDPVRRLYASMLAKAGQFDAALAMWRQIYKESENIWIQRIAAGHLFNITVERDLLHLSGAVAEYELHMGRKPLRGGELISAGLLRAVPLDPYDQPYVYDAPSASFKCTSKYSYGRMPRKILPPSS
jgi:tetratricopeptide (TPR) repeat protein